MSMDRRTFLSTAAFASTALVTGRYRRLLAAPIVTPSTDPSAATKPYDLVAIKGGEPGAMFDASIEAMGGMKAFVKRGQKVVVKPNIGWDVPPERAGNTNPQLVARIVQQCLAAGAKEVYVFDNPCDNWKRSYKNSGIEAAAKQAGAKVAPASSESYYQSVAVPGAKNLEGVKVHELLLQCDVFINVPILKHHSGSDLTVGMKNMMGVVWDRGFWHGHDLHHCIAEFAAFRKPDLTVVDAYNVMKNHGPRGVSVDDIVQMKSLLMGTDIVAVDAAAAKLLGVEPSSVRYIQLAAEAGRGHMELEKLNIKRMSL